MPRHICLLKFNMITSTLVLARLGYLTRPRDDGDFGAARVIRLVQKILNFDRPSFEN